MKELFFNFCFWITFTWEVCISKWVGEIDGDSFDSIWSKISIVFQNFQWIQII